MSEEYSSCDADLRSAREDSVLGMDEPLSAPSRYTCVCGATSERISVTVKPTTGGHFSVAIPSDDSVDHLRLIVSQKLKVPRERICLLYRNRPLRDGTLESNHVQHGCQLTLLPSVESGLMSHRPEQSVMQALENLTPSQVTEFLSGKAPLNLTVRLGDHMMLIQLQLSPAQAASRRNKLSSSAGPAAATSVQQSFNNSRSGVDPCTPPQQQQQAPRRTSAPAAGSSRSMLDAARPTSASADGRRQQRGSPTTSSSGAATSCHHQRQRSQDEAVSLRAQLDMRALAEASRNLTRTLKQLSSEVLTGSGSDDEAAGAAAAAAGPAAAPPSASVAPAPCVPQPVVQAADLTPPTPADVPSTSTNEDSSNRRHPGAIIESMHHHGKGVYSGTFSGTLNPALQDKMGRPKRDISTIIHILNDLLCAAPQYQRSSDTGAAEHPVSLVAPAAGTTSALSADQRSRTIVMEEELLPADQTQATRGKVERLKLVMEERRQRRRQRRTARSAPYTTSWSATSETAAAAAVAAAAQELLEPAGDATDADMTDVTPALVACGGQHAL